MDFNFPILKSPLKEHISIKDKLLSLIDHQLADRIQKTNNPFKDSISKLDWSKNNDFERKWVKFILPYLENNFKHQLRKVGLKGPTIKEIWFQQYLKKDIHCWHIHGSSFTGVYYLEFDETSPKTQVIEPMNKNKKSIKAKEGDVVIFPSVYIHRSPLVECDKRKTIISFNFEAYEIDYDYLENLQKKYK